MNKIKAFFGAAAVFLIFCFLTLPAGAYLSVNWGFVLEELLINRHYSHGCFHLTPLGVKVFYETVPKGVPIVVKSYQDTPHPWLVKELPDLLLCINSPDTLLQAKRAFAAPEKLLIEAYPNPGIFIFYFDEKPYATLRFRPGFEKKGALYFGFSGGEPLYDPYFLTPTAAGTFETLFYTANFFAPRYPLTTSIPYGAKIFKSGQSYFYEKSGQKIPLPATVTEDFNQPKENRQFCFFEEIFDKKGKILLARWGSHDYGIYVIGLSPDGRSINQDLIYAAGPVLNDQRVIVDELAKIIADGNDDFNLARATSKTFQEEKTFYDFLMAPSEVLNRPNLSLETKLYLIYYKLFHRLPLEKNEKKEINPVYEAALNYFIFGKRYLKQKDTKALIAAGAAFPKNGAVAFNEERIQGIYYNLYELANYVESGAQRFQRLTELWLIFAEFKKDLAQNNPGFLSSEKIKKIITNQLELKN